MYKRQIKYIGWCLNLPDHTYIASGIHRSEGRWFNSFVSNVLYLGPGTGSRIRDQEHGTSCVKYVSVFGLGPVISQSFVKNGLGERTMYLRNSIWRGAHH